MLTPYPSLNPYQEHELAVEAPHVLYVEESGNPQGIPVLFVHGGPGAGCNPDQRRYFDPQIYRIILFDQRGCGRSKPHASLENNTTAALVTDMEAIRNYLGIDRWLLFGGSWGSTLSLVYAQTHPERVLALILRGIFLVRPEEIHWFYQAGTRIIYPDYWQDFVQLIPEAERNNFVAAYYKRLTGTDEVTRMAAAKAWAMWEARCASLQPNSALIEAFTTSHCALSVARIECHYFMHDAFLEPNQILRDMHKIQHIPGIIVHGRYDMICPLDNAWTLHQSWPLSELKIIRDAGHSASEPGMTDALIHATKNFGIHFG